MRSGVLRAQLMSVMGGKRTLARRAWVSFTGHSIAHDNRSPRDRRPRLLFARSGRKVLIQMVTLTKRP